MKIVEFVVSCVRVYNSMLFSMIISRNGHFRDVAVLNERLVAFFGLHFLNKSGLMNRKRLPNSKQARIGCCIRVFGCKIGLQNAFAELKSCIFQCMW